MVLIPVGTTAIFAWTDLDDLIIISSCIPGPEGERVGECWKRFADAHLRTTSRQLGHAHCADALVSSDGEMTPSSNHRTDGCVY